MSSASKRFGDSRLIMWWTPGSLATVAERMPGSRYSARSVSIGCTRVARTAGTVHATTDAAPTSTAIPA